MSPPQSVQQAPVIQDNYYSFKRTNDAIDFSNYIKSRGRAMGKPYQALVERTTSTVTVKQVPLDVLVKILAKAPVQPEKSWTA